MASYHTVPINDVTEMTVEGDLDLEASREILLDVVRDAGLAGHHLLVDLRGATSALSFRDVYQLVQVLVEHPAAFSGRLALLDTYDKSLEKAQFFQSSASERGFQVRAFVDEDAAVAWLEAAVQEA